MNENLRISEIDHLRRHWKSRYKFFTKSEALPRDASPLRFPGGKGSLKYFLADAIFTNGLQGKTLIEPFCGGSGATLPLLRSNVIGKLFLNDADPAIYSFWKSVFFDTERFLDLLYDTPVTIDTWKQFKSDMRAPNSLSSLQLGFRTLFFNRTNRSGLLIGGPIGGINQDGKYKLSCRFNKDALAGRIKELARYRNKVNVSNLDALEYLHKHRMEASGDSFIFLDPPYVKHGYNIYRKFAFKENDHFRLASFIKDKRWTWLLTYDDSPLIHRLYSERMKGVVEYSYYMQKAKIGRELVLASSLCRISFPGTDREQQQDSRISSGQNCP